MESSWRKYKRLRRNPMYNEIRKEALRNEELEYWFLTISVGIVGAIVITLLILKFIS